MSGVELTNARRKIESLEADLRRANDALNKKDRIIAEKDEEVGVQRRSPLLESVLGSTNAGYQE